MALETTIAGIEAWCGIESPTPAITTIVELAAESAEGIIKHYRGLTSTDDLEPEYQSLAIEIGVELYRKRGVEGTVQFSENGVSRMYESGSVSPSLLARIKLPVVTG